MKQGLMLILSYAIANGPQAGRLPDYEQPQSGMVSLYIEKSPALNFGTLDSSGSGGAVTITTTNHRMVDGPIMLSGTASYERAKIKIKGKPGETYRIYLPDRFMIKSDNTAYMDKVYEINVTNLRSYSVTAGKEGKTGRIDLNGEDTVYVGGTLNLPKNAMPGNYSGFIPLTVSY